jgi:hypothetical protein
MASTAAVNFQRASGHRPLGTRNRTWPAVSEVSPCRRPGSSFSSSSRLLCAYILFS